MRQCSNYCVQHMQKRPRYIIITTIIIIITCRWETQRISAKKHSSNNVKANCKFKASLKRYQQKACTLFHLESLLLTLVYFCIAQC